MCLLQIFSPSQWFVFLILIFIEGFNFNEVWLFGISFMPLVLYLKSHHQTQGHLGFLLHYLLEVLGEFCFLSFFFFFIYLYKLEANYFTVL